MVLQFLTVLDSVCDCCQVAHNIRHQYNLEGVKLHTNDHTSVSLWVESVNKSCECDSVEENPVQLFKTRREAVM